jgi:CheY-like chemotaxis protein
MGGRLEVQSEPGKGSEFHFTLPLRLTRKRAQAPVENPAGTLSLPGLRILIAEDNPVNLMVAERILAKWGVETVAARNGRELLNAYRTGNYHLLLVDLDMPEMDGAEAVAEIRRTDTHIPVIAFTAAVYDNIQSDLLAKGFNDFLPKPFRPETLHRKICQLTAVAEASVSA